MKFMRESKGKYYRLGRGTTDYRSDDGLYTPSRSKIQGRKEVFCAPEGSAPRALRRACKVEYNSVVAPDKVSGASVREATVFARTTAPPKGEWSWRMIQRGRGRSALRA